MWAGMGGDDGLTMWRQSAKRFCVAGCRQLLLPVLGWGHLCSAEDWVSNVWEGRLQEDTKKGSGCLL